eukprot:TRINITY_DN5810_c0_g1_i5.p1 TRINITY_DN5810_c0_g1~~TRINITY_DN5810_c0_g1_i5.p1  ORF type:complete len:343 (-),score=64.11 TRINITY_DN5810_c0_g1_i5:426-1382(-)
MDNVAEGVVTTDRASTPIEEELNEEGSMSLIADDVMRTAIDATANTSSQGGTRPSSAQAEQSTALVTSSEAAARAGAGPTRTLSAGRQLGASRSGRLARDASKVSIASSDFSMDAVVAKVVENAADSSVQARELASPTQQSSALAVSDSARGGSDVAAESVADGLLRAALSPVVDQPLQELVELQPAEDVAYTLPAVLPPSSASQQVAPLNAADVSSAVSRACDKQDQAPQDIGEFAQAHTPCVQSEPQADRRILDRGASCLSVGSGVASVDGLVASVVERVAETTADPGLAEPTVRASTPVEESAVAITYVVSSCKN